MVHETPLDALLAELGADLGLPGLAFDERGSCRLAIDALEVALERTEGGSVLFLTCMVGELPGTGREAAMARLLDANFLFKGTQGATLGVAANSPVVLLAHRAPAQSLNLLELRQMLENFVTAAEHARGLLEPGPAAAVEADAGMLPAFMIRG